MRTNEIDQGRTRLSAVRMLWVVVLVLACSSVPPHPQAGDLGPGFSERSVQAHFAALASIGPRAPRTSADEAARAYLEREFRLAGTRVVLEEVGANRHLVAEIEGRSADIVLLVAAYPSEGAAGSIDDSGGVLLLELARVLGQSTPPYTLRFALAELRRSYAALEGDLARESVEAGASAPPPDEIRNRLVEAGENLAEAFQAEKGSLERFRAVIVFETRARSGMRFDRDLRSHPVFREIFWERAASLGHREMFAPDAGWSSLRSLQEGFRARSMDRVLTLIDVESSRPEAAAGTPTGGEQFDGLAALGIVTVEAVNQLMRRFEKVDAFSD